MPPGRRRITGGYTDHQIEALLSGLGARIRQQRLHHGLTQAKLAAVLGLTAPSVANIESGVQGPFSVLTLAGLRREFSCSADWLLGPEQTVNRPSPDALMSNPQSITPPDVPTLLRAAADALDARYEPDPARAGAT